MAHVISCSPVIVKEPVLESSNDVGVIEVHVFNATGEVFKDDEALVNMGHAPDVQVPVQVETLKVPFDPVADTNPVHGEDQVTPVPRDDDFVVDVVVEQ